MQLNSENIGDINQIEISYLKYIFDFEIGSNKSPISVAWEKFSRLLKNRCIELILNLFGNFSVGRQNTAIDRSFSPSANLLRI